MLKKIHLFHWKINLIRMLDKMINYLDYLPQQSSFRFIDEVTCYKQGKYMKAVLYLDSLPREIIASTIFFPPSFITEALAQLGVLFVQFETEPLRENEVP